MKNIVLEQKSECIVTTDDIDLNIKSGKNKLCLNVYFKIHDLYMEVRKKNGIVNTFYFKDKSDRKGYDYGWWSDAEVVFFNDGKKHR